MFTLETVTTINLINELLSRKATDRIYSNWWEVEDVLYDCKEFLENRDGTDTGGT